MFHFDQQVVAAFLQSQGNPVLIRDHMCWQDDAKNFI